MTSVRLVPRLDIKGHNLVKGIHLEGLRVLGDPAIYAQRYYRSGADELLLMDAVASLYGRNSLHDIVQATANQVFIPLTVGGGVRRLQDIADLLRIGADRVAINTHALKKPDFVARAADRFGSAAIAVSIEAKRQQDGSYHAFCANGRDDSGRDVIEWANHAAELGAGEILLTSIDRDGTGHGFDIDLVAKVAATVPVPVSASGGGGSIDDVIDVIDRGHVNGVCLATMLHYHDLQGVSASNDSYGFQIVDESYSTSCGTFDLEDVVRSVRAASGT